MLDSRRLRTFHEVVTTGSFTAAAHSLGYTQPAVTQQIRALEREVGVHLFTRNGRRMRLTEAGEALARHSERILRDMQDAQQQLQALARLRAERVRVCAFPSITATLIPEVVAGLLAEHPTLRVELQEAEPPESMHRLVAGECDIALSFSYPGARAELPPDVVEINLLEDLLVALLPAGHPLTRRRAVRLTELQQARWVAGCSRCRANFLTICAEEGFDPDIVFTTDDNLALQSLVAAGVGIAVAPSLVLSFLNHRQVAGRVIEPNVRRQISAYVLREHQDLPAVELVLDGMRSAAAARSGC
ncbi:LysR family transcriptional regulator [Streptomyces cadmiisoli]|uniref:LysR family transcriptional regulator n=1 Tax=Streptomyces cadmiisoli TaxID=2184053 RepID=A0A2Z4J937_9ACTN|nr:LysR family transcriptional regulator [Streptomyces cadmiisoli]AWW41631.1 LysR family transcriptional regulator [Streptomyces cadmiisoli]